MNSLSLARSVRTETLQQMLRQLRNVVEAIAQRGQVNFERVHAEHQVLAEVAGFDHFFQAAMRGADHAHVDV